MSASFPTAVKSFTTKNPGDTIQVADVNDLQDEVHAIEDGILSGTANLSVNNLTVGGTLSAPASADQPPFVRVFNSTNTNVDNGAEVALNFASVKFASTTGMHSTGVNGTKLVPVSSGIYAISAHVEWEGSSGGTYRQMEIRVDGSSAIARVMTTPAQSANVTRQSLHTVYRFASTTQYVELLVTHNAGSSLAIQATADYSPHFMMVKQR